MPEIVLPTAAKQDEILNRLISGVGTDWSKYSPLFQNFNKTMAVSNTYETVLSITGKGYISHTTLSYITGDGYLKITVDDAILLWCKTETSGVVGFSEISAIQDAGSTGLKFLAYHSNKLDALVPSANIKNLPFNDPSSAASSVLSHPIFFDKNFKVEVAAVPTNQLMRCLIVGGVE